MNGHHAFTSIFEGIGGIPEHSFHPELQVETCAAIGARRSVILGPADGPFGAAGDVAIVFLHRVPTERGVDGGGGPALGCPFDRPERIFTSAQSPAAGGKAKRRLNRFGRRFYQAKFTLDVGRGCLLPAFRTWRLCEPDFRYPQPVIVDRHLAFQPKESALIEPANNGGVSGIQTAWFPAGLPASWARPAESRFRRRS